MPVHTLRAAAVLATGLVATLPATARAGGALDPFLPKDGKIAGHVMSFSVAPEDQAISSQFRHAVQDHMDWFKKAVTGNKPGQPLPYDKLMGITEAQYERLQHMKPEMHEGEAVTIGVERSADGTVKFAPQGEQAATLKDVSFPPDDKAAKTPFGTLAIFNEIHQVDPSGPLGAWNGVEWAQVEPADADEPSAKIAFGKRTSDGSGLMYYQVAPYKDHKEQSFVLFYDLK